jgi:ribonuclease HII
MLIYAGIDEAGYGPMFGPLVIARTVFALEHHEPAGEPPAMWPLLKSAVCRSAKDKRRRIAVNDSKKLYTPAAGLGHLERGVLAFAHLAGHEPATLDDLLSALGVDMSSRSPDLLWYHDDEGGPAVPSAWTVEQIAISRGQLRRCAEQAAVRLADAAAAVIFEDRFNHIVATTRSKASCAWQFVAGHLWAIWEQFGRHNPWVVVDRQGGRRVYHPQLQLLFETAELRLLDESDDISRYHLRDMAAGRSMTISFETTSEDRHMPVALASMAAKYLREMLMVRFNRFWQTHAPQVRRTAGYVLDGRRFLAEIDMHIDRLGIDRDTLIRCC